MPLSYHSLFMNNFSTVFKSPFAKLGLFAVPLIIGIVAMNVFFPKESPDDYSSFIIAFEFAKTPEQITALFDLLTPAEDATSSLSVAEKITGLNIGNYIDFFFMLTYSSFLFLFFKKAALHYNLKWLKLAMPLAILAFISDIGENVFLLKIANAYPETTKITEALSVLPFFVWTKWLALALICALGSIAFLLGKRLITKLLAFVLIIPIILGVMALVTQAALMIDGFAVSIFIGIGILVLSCFWLK